MSTPKLALLAAGGTGGHLFPAYALAAELGQRGIVVDLVTDTRGDRYGTGFPARNVHQISSATMTSKAPQAVAKTVWSLSRGIADGVKLLGEIKPDVVVGFGGYPTFPPLMAAKMRSVPCAIHEQNAVLGRANRLLAKRVQAVATSFAVTKYLDGELADKAVITGNPVRSVVLEAATRPYWPSVDNEPFHLVVFGGSQGARYFSDTVPGALAMLPERLSSRMRVVQQAREEDVDRVRAAYRDLGISAEVDTFFENLPDVISQSHLAITRAGASTIAELTVIGRPSVLVPLPHSVDNDQLENARRFAETGGAWCVEQKDLTQEGLAQELANVLAEPDILTTAAAHAKEQGVGDAVVRLADLAEDLMA